MRASTCAGRGPEGAQDKSARDLLQGPWHLFLRDRQATVTGPWWSPLALWGLTGKTEGVYRWERSTRVLLLLVPRVVGNQTINGTIGSLGDFDLPAKHNDKGTGVLVYPSGTPSTVPSADIEWVVA